MDPSPASETAVLDRSAFSETIELPALRLEKAKCDPTVKNPLLKDFVFRRPKIKPILHDPTDPQKFRLLLLKEEAGKDLSGLPDDSKSFAESAAESLTSVPLTFTYDEMSAEEVLRKLLFEGVGRRQERDGKEEGETAEEVEGGRRSTKTEEKENAGDDENETGGEPGEIPQSFETVGHIAHLNLRKEHLPFKFQIGQVVLDKNAHIRTVVNKRSNLKNEFRTMDLELLAGVADFSAETKENGLTFAIQYDKVYWNSRLQAERSRLSDTIATGFLPTDSSESGESGKSGSETRALLEAACKGKVPVVCDLFAGAGAFAIYLAKRGIEVFANDLNPVGTEGITENAMKNKVSSLVHPLNMDARAAARHFSEALGLLGGQEGGCEGEEKQSEKKERVVHFIMNLPELSVDFLDAFRGLYNFAGIPASAPGPPCIVHCYFFSRSDPAEEEAKGRICTALGTAELPPVRLCEEVRSVAPNKRMYCLHFILPELVLRDSSASSQSSRAVASSSMPAQSGSGKRPPAAETSEVGGESGGVSACGGGTNSGLKKVRRTEGTEETAEAHRVGGELSAEPGGSIEQPTTMEDI